MHRCYLKEHQLVVASSDREVGCEQGMLLLDTFRFLLCIISLVSSLKLDTLVTIWLVSIKGMLARARNSQLCNGIRLPLQAPHNMKRGWLALNHGDIRLWRSAILKEIWGSSCSLWQQASWTIHQRLQLLGISYSSTKTNANKHVSFGDKWGVWFEGSPHSRMS